MPYCLILIVPSRNTVPGGIQSRFYRAIDTDSPQTGSGIIYTEDAACLGRRPCILFLSCRQKASRLLQRHRLGSGTDRHGNWGCSCSKAHLGVQNALNRHLSCASRSARLIRQALIDIHYFSAVSIKCQQSVPRNAPGTIESPNRQIAYRYGRGSGLFPSMGIDPIRCMPW